MTDYDYRLVEGDSARLEHTIGLDLSDINGVTFRMRNQSSGDLVADKSGGVVEASDGTVSVEIDGSNSETEQTGVHSAEWVVDRGSIGVRRFPANEPMTVYIRESV